jgi:hypothetical protein
MFFKHLTANDMKIEPFPFKRELSMQAYILDNEQVLSLDGDIYTDVEILDAEAHIVNGGSNGSINGRIDILASYSQSKMAIIELKKDNLDENSLNQLENYLKEFPKKFSDDNLKEKYQIGFDTDSWIGVLVGRTIDSELAKRLRDGYSYDGTIPVAALTMQRFRGSDGNVYVITDTYFNCPDNGNNARNMDKYSFNNGCYGKGRLVLAVIKKYVQDHPGVTYPQLKEIFPDKLQGHAVFVTFESALEIFSSKGRKRHFIKPDEIIVLGCGTEIAVSNQWGIGNIGNFISCARGPKYIIQDGCEDKKLVTSNLEKKCEYCGVRKATTFVERWDTWNRTSNRICACKDCAEKNKQDLMT